MNILVKLTRRAARETLNRLQGRHPLRNGSVFEPFFIIGSGRAGNTLVRRVLFAHPEVYIPPETYVLGASIAQFERNSSLEWEALCRNIIAMFAFSQDADTFPTLHFRPLYLQLLNTPQSQRSYDQIINDFYFYLAQQVKPKVKIWGDKTPMNTGSLDKIYSAFPYAKFIHIVRDPYDVVASYLKMGRYNNVEDAANRWLDAVNDCHEFGQSHPRQYILISYENLVSEPKIVVKNIYDFLNIEFTQDLLNPLDSLEMMGDITARTHYNNVNDEISTRNIGKGRENLSKEELDKIGKITGKVGEQFGYM